MAIVSTIYIYVDLSDVAVGMHEQSWDNLVTCNLSYVISRVHNGLLVIYITFWVQSKLSVLHACS